MLRRLVELVDTEEGGVTGSADIARLRALHPGLLSFDAWLAKTGAARFRALLERAV